jgi:hypothetical protein
MQKSGCQFAAHHHACEAKNSFEDVHNSEDDQYKGHYNYFAVHFNANFSGVFNLGANYTFLNS